MIPGERKGYTLQWLQPREFHGLHIVDGLQRNRTQMSNISTHVILSILKRWKDSFRGEERCDDDLSKSLPGVNYRTGAGCHGRRLWNLSHSVRQDCKAAWVLLFFQEKLRMIQESSIPLHHSPRSKGLVSHVSKGEAAFLVWVGQIPLPRTLGWCCLHRKLQGWSQRGRRPPIVMMYTQPRPGGGTLKQRKLVWSLKAHGITYWILLLWDPITFLPSYFSI